MDTAAVTLLGTAGVIDRPDPAQAVHVARQAMIGAVYALAPLALLVLTVAVLSAPLQGGARPVPALLLPKLNRLNPLHGVKRMFGPQGGWMAAKSVGKSVALAVVIQTSVQSLVPSLLAAGTIPLSRLVADCVTAVLRLIRYAAAAGLVMAVGDLMVIRRRNNKSLRMTKQEVKEELKSSDGNPHLKSTLRSRAIAISRNRMLADVPRADVVVVNPTHVAVALKYEAGRGAPRVLAKGGDHMAARIREIAQRHRVPMVHDVTLARTLHGTVEVGREIPAELFQAVARVLAFVMTLKSRGSAAGVHTVRPLAGTRR
jgi:flagellar biosynthetic protein FlhB